MTDQTIHHSLAYSLDIAHDTDGIAVGARPRGHAIDGIRRGLRVLLADFRAVPAQAWIVLAVATVLSNLFIALA